MTEPRGIDPREVAYEAVFEYLRSHPAAVGTNAHAWRCVHAALNAARIGVPVDPQTGQRMTEVGHD